MQIRSYDENEHYMVDAGFQNNPPEDRPFVLGVEHGKSDGFCGRDLASELIRERIRGLYLALASEARPTRGRRYYKQAIRRRLETMFSRSFRALRPSAPFGRDESYDTVSLPLRLHTGE